MPMFLHKQNLNVFFAVFHSHTAVTDRNVTNTLSPFLSLPLSLTHTHTHTHIYPRSRI